MNECYCKNKDTNFLTWFIQLIAPVLTGAKPAEILSFPSEEKQIEKLKSIRSLISGNHKLILHEFSFCTQCTKLFIYNPKAMKETLLDKRNQRFLAQLGYPLACEAEVYIDILIEKMSKGVIPDEIGVFLGYPLKDVMGFVGHSSLKLTKVRGWRVYGDPRLSDRKYNDFMEAKACIKRLLDHSSPYGILSIV